MGVCNCSMFCCTLLYVHPSFCNHLDGDERDSCFAKFVFLVYHDCCVAILAVPWVFLQFVIVVFPDHTHYLLL